LELQESLMSGIDYSLGIFSHTSHTYHRFIVSEAFAAKNLVL